MTTGNKPALPPEDALARLLQEAGPRPTIDAERADRVRQAVHAQWIETTRPEPRRRHIGRWLIAAAAAASLLTMMRWSARESAPAPASSIVAVGTIETVRGALLASERPAGPGDTVLTGSWLETGANARAGVRLASGPSLRLDVATRVRVESPTVFTLERGAVYVDSGESEVPLTIRTPLGLARDIGTQFEVRLRGDDVLVRVREGIVELERGERTYQASAGNELRLKPAGDIELGTVLPYAPQWDWITRTAPPFELDGTTLDIFLRWVSREQGLTVHFEDEALETDLDTILLEGPVLNIVPRAALDTVLPACGLSYRVDNGQLWIADAR